jgi:hypothetical protein
MYYSEGIGIAHTIQMHLNICCNCILIQSLQSFTSSNLGEDFTEGAAAESANESTVVDAVALLGICF